MNESSEPSKDLVTKLRGILGFNPLKTPASKGDSFFNSKVDPGEVFSYYSNVTKSSAAISKMEDRIKTMPGVKVDVKDKGRNPRGGGQTENRYYSFDIQVDGKTLYALYMIEDRAVSFAHYLYVYEDPKLRTAKIK